MSNISDIAFVQVDSEEGDIEISIIKSLKPEEFELFLSKFLQLEMYRFWDDPDHHEQGYNIMITFKNGDYHLINQSTTVHFSDGKHRYRSVYYYIGDAFGILWKEYTGLDYSI